MFLKNMFSKNNKSSMDKIDTYKEMLDLVCQKRDFEGLRSKVGLVLDYSRSMSESYQNGSVQELLNKIIPLALKFDDNESLDIWIFENGFHRLENVTLKNLDGYIEKVRKKYYMGGTNYCPVMKDVKKRYIDEEPSDLPSYLLFVTDGEASDNAKVPGLIKEYSEYPIFWQFVGIGYSEFSLLKKLDDIEDRIVDNADFFQVDNIKDMCSDEIYDKLLNEFPDWVNEVKEKGILK